MQLAIVYAVVDDWATPILELDEEEEEHVGMIEVHEELVVCLTFQVCKSLSPACWILFTMGGSLWALLYIILVFLTDYMVEKWDFCTVTARASFSPHPANIESGRYTSIAFGIGIVSSLAAGLTSHSCSSFPRP